MLEGRLVSEYHTWIPYIFTQKVKNYEKTGEFGQLELNKVGNSVINYKRNLKQNVNFSSTVFIELN